MEWYEDFGVFIDPKPLPPSVHQFEGPHGVALVDVYGEGKTTKGWGLSNSDGSPGFIEQYAKKAFWSKPRVLDAVKRDKPFAIVMRSVNLVALDIDRHMDDGGADGFIAAAKLELPPTLAQTSKSGAGRHLFYSTEEDWDPAKGFGAYDDAIGIVPGVDVRATGCIYRHAQQRWNHEPIAPLPDSVRELLDHRRQQKLAQHAVLAAAAAAPPDAEEALIMHDALTRELAKPIDTGKRNVSLYAIGIKMRDAGYPDWQGAIRDRALKLGLESTETERIIANVAKAP